MIGLLFDTLPYFGLIALGYGAAILGLFSRNATEHLTQFVFYFALSAMLFEFTSSLDFKVILHWPYILAYAIASLILYTSIIGISRFLGTPSEVAITQGQSSIIGNMGWMGLAMLPTLLGYKAIPFIIMVLIVDLVLFGPLFVTSITICREGLLRVGVIQNILFGLIKNPMILSIIVGLLVSGLKIDQPKQFQIFVDLLAGASVPGALFAIGASMIYCRTESILIPSFLGILKLFVHPTCVGLLAHYGFGLELFETSVMIACASMPTAANVYMLATHYKIPGDQISTSILVSTIFSLGSIPTVIWITQQVLR